MTNPELEMWKAVAESTVTVIIGQPTNQDIDSLEDELMEIASNQHSDLGGGLHGHAGLLKSAAEYELMAPGTPFLFPANPGFYPQGNIPAAQCGQWEAEHKGLIAQFQTCVGARKGLKDLILEAVEEDYLLELQAEGSAYLNVTPLQMLTHLRDRWGTMDYVDITALLAECDAPWNAAEVPQKYFNRMDKARKQLAHANVQVDERAMVVKALKSFKDTGDYNAPIREWEAKPAALQTYVNLKTLMNTEFTKLNRQDATTARATGHASANNMVEEMAQQTEELLAQLTECQGKQLEAAMKSTADALEKLTAAILEKPTPSGTNQQKNKKVVICPHCDIKHKKHDQCWELPANAANRPAGWKSKKSTST
jgi:hypothetical protein